MRTHTATIITRLVTNVIRKTLEKFGITQVCACARVCRVAACDRPYGALRIVQGRMGLLVAFSTVVIMIVFVFLFLGISAFSDAGVMETIIR